MGKLRIERADFDILEKLSGDRLSVHEDRVDWRAGDLVVSLTELDSRGFFDQNGVRIEFDARLRDGNVEIDFK